MKIAYGRGWLQSCYDRSPALLQNVATSAYGWRLHRRAFGSHFRRYYASLEKSQWYAPEQLQALQNRLLADFVAYAYTYSPYWRRLFDDLGVAPEQITAPEALRRLPRLEKETLRQQLGDIESRAYVDRPDLTVPVHTSGTTGKALHLKLTREVWERDYAFRELHHSWGGIHLGERVATFAGHPVVPTTRVQPPFWRENWADNQVLFSAQHITRANLPYYAAQLQRFQPILIHGYPSSLYLVALYLRDCGIATIRPRAVYTHSETLLDAQRALLEQVFGCKVFNWYGNTEMTGHIVECERGSLHVKMEHSVVEFVRPDGTPAQPGELAELVCTGFGNYATPLIRYRTGDVAVPSDRVCACGRAGPLVEQIIGRVEDIIVTPDGRHVGRLDHVFKDTLNVEEAQIVQDDPASVCVKIVKRPAFGAPDMAALERELRLRLGPAIRIEYSFVDRIPRERNGKFRFVVSSVPVALADNPH